MRAVILAGGSGTRLRPYTTVLPKPLMPVGDFPIAEIILRQLRHFGIDEIIFSVGYLHQLIEAYFGDGSQWGVRIEYLKEEQPLGTAGPLALLEQFDEPVIVMNGDILSDLDYAALYRAHLDSDADITVAAYEKKIKVDLGVIKTTGDHQVVAYIEKPDYNFQVSMGVYVFSPSVVRFIPSQKRFDFPDLVKSMLAQRRQVKVYPFDGIWLDIGRSDDYQIATKIFGENRSRLLPQEAERWDIIPEKGERQRLRY